MYMTIRERARNKIWSRIITKHIQIEDVRKDLEKGNFGIITEEEMRSMFNGLKTDLKYMIIFISLQKQEMILKIGKIQIIFNKLGLHKRYLLNTIIELRSEIIKDVLTYNKTGRIPVKKLIHKAKLVKKYSKRLRLLDM